MRRPPTALSTRTPASQRTVPMRRGEPSSGGWSRRVGYSCRSGRLRSTRRLGTRTTALAACRSSPEFGVADRDARRDTIENTFTLRVRWPWAEQTDLRVGCNFSHEEVFTADLNDGRSNSSGLSDIEIGLTNQLPCEIHSLPTCWVRCIGRPPLARARSRSATSLVRRAGDLSGGKPVGRPEHDRFSQQSP